MSSSGIDICRPSTFIIAANQYEGPRLFALSFLLRRAEEYADVLADESIEEYALEHSGRVVIISSVALEYAHTSSGEITGVAAASVFTTTLADELRTGEIPIVTVMAWFPITNFIYSDMRASAQR